MSECRLATLGGGARSGALAAGGADAGALCGDAPMLDVVPPGAPGDVPPGAIGPTLLSGAVVTPLVPAVVVLATVVPSAAGGVSRNTWPTRIRFTFSMLFHAASSR